MPRTTGDATSRFVPRRPGPIALVVFYFVYAVNVVSTFTALTTRDLLPWYVILFALFLLLYSLVLWHPQMPWWISHLYFICQSIVVLVLLALDPEMDFQTRDFTFLSYQVALVFSGQVRWIWVGLLTLLIPGSLDISMDLLHALARALPTMAFAVVLPAYIAANEALETAVLDGEALLVQLQDAHQQLQAFADQVGEMTAVEERERLARELHDSVSQTLFSILLNTRAAQILAEREPANLQAQLEQLQQLAQGALIQMRGLLGQLRPKNT